MGKKETNQLIICAALMLGLIFGIFNVFKSQSEKNREAPKGSSGQKPSPDTSGPKGIFSLLEEQTKNLEIKRDPFIKETAKIMAQSSPSNFNLSGVAWDENKPTAIINNKVIEKGDVLDGYTVIEIHKDYVILDDGSGKGVIQIYLQE